jgi:hypothetical protein
LSVEAGDSTALSSKAVLEREARAGNLTLDNPTFAAQQFLHMVIALPQRRALGLGMPMTR